MSCYLKIFSTLWHSNRKNKKLNWFSNVVRKKSNKILRKIMEMEKQAKTKCDTKKIDETNWEIDMRKQKIIKEMKTLTSNRKKQCST